MPERNSAFASFLSAVIVLLAFVSVWKTLKEQGLIDGQAAVLPASKQPETLTLTATDDHRFYWNEQGPYPLAESNYRLSVWSKAAHQPRVVITGDRNARLVDAMQLLSEVRAQGITRYSVEMRTSAQP